MSTTTPTHENGSEVQTLDERDRRALEQYLTVLSDVDRAKDAADLFLVVSQSGKEYLVDRRERVCECPDYQYREVDGGCKHLRRVAFATGERAIPAGVDHDTQLGEHVTGGPRYTSPDGGVESTTDTTTSATADLDAGKTETRTEVEAPTLDEAPTMDRDSHDTLATIVAQTTSTIEALPDWEVYNAACKASVATIERLVDEATDDVDGRHGHDASDANEEMSE